MIIQSIDYWAIAAPLILALTAGLVLLLDAFLPNGPGGVSTHPGVSGNGRRTPGGEAFPRASGNQAQAVTEVAGDEVRAGGRKPYARGLLGLITLGGVVAALGVVVAQAVQGRERRTFCVPGSLLDGRDSAGTGPLAAESCSFVVDRFTLVFAGLVLAAGVVVVLLSMAELSDRRIPVGEWHFLLLCTLTGAVLLPASRDLIMLVVSLELVSLPVFALTAMKRYDGRSSEAALKLFLVSVVSTAIMLFGVSLLYGMTGSVYLGRLSPGLVTGAGITTVAIVLVLAGFAFKVAAVPFHFWAGDVYQGAPIPVAALLSVISKAAGFAGLILVLTIGLSGQAAIWGPAVAVIAALTMTFGNVLAMRQRNAVRLLAWSSVAQSGYILAPLGVWAAGVGARAADRAPTSVADAQRAGRALSEPLPASLAGEVGRGVGSATGASVAYLVFYAAMNIGAFAVVMLISRAAARNDLDDYRGLVFRRPGTALALAFFLVCLAGLPPGLAGLFAKVVVFREIVEGGLGWLAVVMAINTVIGLYYYLAWTAKLFASPPAGESHKRSMPVAVAVGLAALFVIVFSVAPQVVLSIVG